MKNAKLKSLSTAIALGFSAMMCQSAHASEKQVGDLEIYKASDDGTVKLMMMLDTSGSMSERVVTDGSACELPIFNDGVAVYELVQSTSNTTPSYTRYTCKVNGKKRRYVYARVGNTYYECGDAACDKVSRTIVQPRDIASYQYIQKAVGGFRGGYYYTGNVYYKASNDVSMTESEKERYPKEARENGEIADRLTRLKDALFAVLDSEKIDSSKTFIGVGQYSTQSDSSNRKSEPDGATGKILVPSLVLDDAQKRRIKDAIVGLEGGAGTPSAMAYAEAGAYMLGTTTLVSGVNSGFNKSVTLSKNGSNYISPIPANPKTCDGHGIYFLTDGEPNSSVRPEYLMMKALGNRSGTFNTRNSLPSGRSDGHGTPEVGAFARSLRIAGNNPRGVSIRTAVVGFGTVFDTSQYKGIEKTLRKPILNDVGLPTGEFEDGVTSKYINCSLIQSVDARNACNWGAKSHPELPGVGGFGEGGFYSAQSTQDVIDSVVEFVGSLNTTIETTPSGTISIPSDPLNALTIQPYAYLPMMQPKVGEADAVWQGNLRKYHTLFGTLFGRGADKNEAGQRLYRPDPARATRGNERFPAHLDPRALDLWQVGGSDSASVETGGARSHLNAGAVPNEPNLENKTSRVVYVEAGPTDTPTLVKIQIVNGKFVIDDIGQLVARGYTIEDMAYLADYLGFSVPKGATYDGDDLQAQITKLDEVIGRTDMRAAPVFGGVNHSVPVLASYRGEYDEDTGNISSNADRRTDFILYGSMDGALHMTNADTGQESFAFIPREMFVSQRTALASDGVSSNGIGRPHFGVDAPWATQASYTYNDAGVNASSMMAYGGLRMGGKGFYGLNLDSATNPKLAFSISDRTTNFERLGQTWAKPTFAKIKTGSNANDFREVVVFGGGYDMCYENPRFRLTDGTTADPNNTDTACNNKTQAEGNAIYMVDAKTGAFIARWQAAVGTAGIGAAGDDRNEMRHSFVSEIIPLDRNNNGFVDSLYASDLGGQLFRIDLREGATGNDMTRRVVRVFNANSNLPADMLPMRFYERPSVSFYDHAGGTLAMVNIASGDRSSPLHTHRDTAAKANRIYGIIDRDLPTFRVAQPGSGHLTSRNLTNNDLQEYNTSDLQSMGNGGRLALINALRDGSRQGWWYPMTRFETDTRVKHLKAIGSSVVTGHVFYTSIYSPDYQYTRDASCSARIVGSTERQMFCLPWGICANPENGALFEESPNGTLGYSKAGPGIQEIATATVTAQANESTGYKTIIGMQTLAERAEDGRRTGSSTGGEGSNAPMKTEVIDGAGKTESSNTAPGEVIVEMSKVLKVDRWYDLATAEANQ